MGTLAVTEELHAKQQEAARKEAERAARMRRGGSPSRPPGRAAERAGLKPGDLVTELDGTPVRDAADLQLRPAARSK